MSNHDEITLGSKSTDKPIFYCNNSNYIGYTDEFQISFSGKMNSSTVENITKEVISTLKIFRRIVILDNGVTDIDVTGLQLLVAIDRHTMSHDVSWTLKLPATSPILDTAARAGLGHRFSTMPVTTL